MGRRAYLFSQPISEASFFSYLGSFEYVYISNRVFVLAFLNQLRLAPPA